MEISLVSDKKIMYPDRLFNFRTVRLVNGHLASWQWQPDIQYDKRKNVYLYFAVKRQLDLSNIQ